MTEFKPELWSDFDGTAVGLVPKTNPRNWTKYPLPLMRGYDDFLRGVQTSGVEIGGIVSRRPDIWARRIATSRSIAKLGLESFFNNSMRIKHAGSEHAKADFIVGQSLFTTIGLIDDKPHKVGAEIMRSVVSSALHYTEPHHPIILGVVAHDHSQTYLEKLAERTKAALVNDYLEEEVKVNGDQTGLRVQTETMRLDVVSLQPYSETGGRAFGRAIIELSELEA